jgi:flagellar basal-body rod modification protein FlgD
MKAEIRNQIAPPTAVDPQPFNNLAVKEKETARDSTAEDKIDFRDLVANSNAEVNRERAAKVKGDLTASNKEEFFKKLEAETNKDFRVPKNKLDKDDFMRLFVEQLKHQDPLNPDDGAEMAAKLAQFNSVEQMVAMNKSLADMASSKDTDRSLQMTNFIGKDMTISGGRIKLEKGRITDSEFALRDGATNTTLQVRDETGRLVFEKEMGNRAAGAHKFSWDGRNKNGVALGDGVYSYNIIATDLEGQIVPVDMNSRVKVTGVDVMDKQGTLYTDFGPVKLSDIKAIGEQGFEQGMKKAKEADAAEPISASVDPAQLDDNGLNRQGAVTADQSDLAAITDSNEMTESQAEQQGAQEDAGPSPADVPLVNGLTEPQAAAAS